MKTCCTGNCNQGDDCPLRGQLAPGVIDGPHYAGRGLLRRFFKWIAGLLGF